MFLILPAIPATSACNQKLQIRVQATGPKAVL